MDGGRLRRLFRVAGVALGHQTAAGGRHIAEPDPVRRTNRFIVVTAAGYLAAGACACIAAIVGEGQEWLYVAPCFLIMGALQLALLSSGPRSDLRRAQSTPRPGRRRRTSRRPPASRDRR